MNGPNSGPAPSAATSDAKTATVLTFASVPPTTAASLLYAFPIEFSPARTLVKLDSHGPMTHFLFPAIFALAASRFPSFSTSMTPHRLRHLVREAVYARDVLMARSTTSRNSTSLRMPLANAGTVERSGVAGKALAVSRLTEPLMSPNGLRPDVWVQIAYAFFFAPLYETDKKGGLTFVVEPKVSSNASDLEFQFKSQVNKPLFSVQ